MKETIQHAGEFSILILDKMGRWCGALKQAPGERSNLVLFLLGGEQTGSDIGNTARRYQDASIANKLFEFSQRSERYALHAGKQHNTVSVGTESKRVFFDPANLAEGVIVEEVEVIP